jgi:accessory gene regulator protein AgrB
MLRKITQGAHFKKTITGLSSMFVFIVMLFLALTLINPFWLP